jgi:hypothetical protein
MKLIVHFMTADVYVTKENKHLKGNDNNYGWGLKIVVVYLLLL